MEPILGERGTSFDELTSFSHELFSPLSRSDQRKWGEVYLRGLLHVSGRKTIRHIADHVVGRSVDQSLQQFLNQSPWSWEAVRRILARRVETIRARAWVIQETVFPKHGESSVGVARQYAASVGRTLNCQLGLAVFLAGANASCAVNWRLQLPKCWDGDAGRRAGACLPAGERHRPRWCHVLDTLDEMHLGWGLRRPVVVADSNGCDVALLLRGFTERGLRYVVRVPRDTPTPHVPVRPARRLNAVWLTNLTNTGPTEFASLIRLRERVRREDLSRLRDDFGLLDFQGRTFAGWQHHVTLVSAAHAFWTLQRMRARHRTHHGQRRNHNGH
jgi:SRSO17 transposase